MDLPSVLVGIAPSAPGLPAWDPEAPSTRRLAEMAGCAPAELGERFGLANLVDDAFDPALDRCRLREAARLFPLASDFRYVLVGWEVTQAFGKLAQIAERGPTPWSGGSSPPVLRWYHARCGHEMAVVPHPSGRNRWYNDRVRREAARSFLTDAAWGAGGANASWQMWLIRCMSDRRLAQAS